MTRVELNADAARDLDRIADFLMAHDPDNALERKNELMAALRVLTYSPAIGRPAPAGTRELIVGKRARGYVVRYMYLPRVEVALVIAIRHQRESSRTR